MSDVRKDLNSADNATILINQQSFEAGFQAGRAHDIEGLIADMRKGSELYHGIVPMFYIEEIIRKHFGKEL